MSFDHIPPPYVPTARGPEKAQLAEAQALGGTASFTVTPTFPGRHRGPEKHRRGQLFVSPDDVVFIAGNTRFEHSEPTITLVKGRLCPPWANTFLFLQNGSSPVRLAGPAHIRHSLRRALKETDLTVNEQTSSGAPDLPRRGRLRS